MSNVFKWRHFQPVIILQCVRWYLKYGISYRDLEEMMEERGVSGFCRKVHHSVNQLINQLFFTVGGSYATSSVALCN